MPEETNAEDVTILVEFPQRPGLVQASLWDMSREELAQKSEEALNRAMNLIANMAHRAGELRQRIPAEFTQAEIEFGVKLDYEAGALLAKAGAEGSISVTLTWERERKPMATLPPPPAADVSTPTPGPLPNPTTADTK